MNDSDHWNFFRGGTIDSRFHRRCSDIRLIGLAIFTLVLILEHAEIAFVARLGDIVVANITADVLSVLVGDLKSHVNAGGKVILSGILREQAENLNALYVKNGYKTLKSTAKGEWVAFLMERL